MLQQLRQLLSEEMMDGVGLMLLLFLLLFSCFLANIESLEEEGGGGGGERIYFKQIDYSNNNKKQ